MTILVDNKVPVDVPGIMSITTDMGGNLHVQVSNQACRKLEHDLLELPGHGVRIPKVKTRNLTGTWFDFGRSRQMQ